MSKILSFLPALLLFNPVYGNFATMHHIGQNSKGGLVETSTEIYGFKSAKLLNGKRSFDVIHSQHGVRAKHPENPVNHSIWKIENKEYWKSRVIEALK